MSKEVFKPLLSGDKYYVSNLGNVKYKRNGVFGKIYKPYVRNGYKSLTLNILGHYKQYSVHRLVAMAWIPNPKNKPQVNHIDGNKLNNRVDNLEWNTASENIKHAIRIKLRDPGVYCSVKDITTGEILHFRDVVGLSKFLDLPYSSLMQYVERSKVTPIRMKYILYIKIEDVKETYNIKKIIVYDYVKKESLTFNTLNKAMLYTGLSSSTFRHELKGRDSYYTGGFSFSYQDIIPLDITPEKAMKDRLKIYTKPIAYLSQSVELYNYDTHKAIICVERKDVMKFINTNLKTIATAIYNSDNNKRSWLLGGYGIKRFDQPYPWYPYSEKEILSSKAGNPYNHPVYILKVDGKDDELIYSSKEAMKITNLPESTFREKVLLIPNGYDFEINFIKANIRKY